MLSNHPGFDAPASRKRRRPALSCEQCRRRKIKCDRTNPCSQCVQSKIPACTYKEEPGRPGVRLPENRDKLLADAPPPVASNDNAQERCFPTPGSSPQTTSTLDKPLSPAGQIRKDSHSGLKSSEPSVQVLLERIQALEEALSKSSNQNSASFLRPVSTQTPGPHLKGNLSKTRFFSHSHWMTYLSQFERILAYQPTTGSFDKSSTGSKLNALLQNCKAMARVVKAQRDDDFIVKPFYKDYMPARELADNLLHLYLKTYESTYRILHIPSFQKEYEQFWLDPQGTDPSVVIKILLVMAIGTCFYRDNLPDVATLRTMAAQWICAAMAWLSSPYEKSRLNLTGLQVHCLLLLARQSNAVGGDLIWNSAGTLMRMAIQMGYHRDPKYFPKIPPYHAELRRRLWATILEINIQSAVDAGMPTLISFDDFDTEPPANLNDEDFDENTKALSSPKPSSVYTQTSIQIILFKALPLRTEIVRVMNDFHSEPSYDDVLRLSKELTTLCNEYSNFMQSARLHPSAFNIKPTVFQQNYLDLSVRRFFLGLHRVYALKARKDPRYYFSRKVCLDAAMIIACPLPDDDFTTLMHLARGMFREVVGHAAAVIGLELVMQIEEEGTSSTNPRHRASREPIYEAMRQVVETMKNRVAEGENNVKCHMFASAVMGQVEAMEAGTSVEEGIYEAANKSAGICYELMKARYHPNVAAAAANGNQEMSSTELQQQQLSQEDISPMELMDPTLGIPDFFEFDFPQQQQQEQMDNKNFAHPGDWFFLSFNTETSW